MLKFLSNITAMIGLGIILYLTIKTLPQINDSEITISKKSLIKSHVVFYYVEKIDDKIKYYSERFLRRFGIVLMKLENHVQKRLLKIKSEKSDTLSS